jgi:hypothetical protein
MACGKGSFVLWQADKCCGWGGLGIICINTWRPQQSTSLDYAGNKLLFHGG